MTTRRWRLVLAIGAVLVVVGGGVAIGATQLSPQRESEAVLEDAARQLGVRPEELGDALRQAFENRLDEAVQDGRLTEEQADRLKERLQMDDFPLFRAPGLGPALPRFGRHGPRLFAALDTAADYLELPEGELRERLREGETLAEIARDEGKSVDGLVNALVAEKTRRLDEAVDDGRLTKAQRDRIVTNLREHVTDMVNGRLPSARPGRLFRGPHSFGPTPLVPPREDAGFGGHPVLPPVA
jgi:transposase-like protein